MNYHIDTVTCLIECDRCHNLFKDTEAAFAHRDPQSSKCQQPVKSGLNPRYKGEHLYWKTFRP